MVLDLPEPLTPLTSDINRNNITCRVFCVLCCVGGGTVTHDHFGMHFLAGWAGHHDERSFSSVVVFLLAFVLVVMFGGLYFVLCWGVAGNKIVLRHFNTTCHSGTLTPHYLLTQPNSCSLTSNSLLNCLDRCCYKSLSNRCCYCLTLC